MTASIDPLISNAMPNTVAVMADAGLTDAEISVTAAALLRMTAERRAGLMAALVQDGVSATTHRTEARAAESTESASGSEHTPLKLSPVLWLITYASGEKQYLSQKPAVWPTPDCRITEFYAAPSRVSRPLERAADARD